MLVLVETRAPKRRLRWKIEDKFWTLRGGRTKRNVRVNVQPRANL